MTETTTDPLVAEVRATRDELAKQFGYDIHEIFKSLRATQQTCGRKYVRYPARAATPITKPNEEHSELATDSLDC